MGLFKERPLCNIWHDVPNGGAMDSDTIVVVTFMALFLVVQLCNWTYYRAKAYRVREDKEWKRQNRGMVRKKGKSYYESGRFG